MVIVINDKILNTHTHTHIHTPTYAYIHTHTHKRHIHTHIYTHTWYILDKICTCICMCVYVYICVCVCIYIIYIHTYFNPSNLEFPQNQTFCMTLWVACFSTDVYPSNLETHLKWFLCLFNTNFTVINPYWLPTDYPLGQSRDCVVCVHRVNYMCTCASVSVCKGARCSSVVRVFAHGAMGCRIDPSWWTHWAISLSSQCSKTGITKDVVCVILSVGWCI